MAFTPKEGQRIYFLKKFQTLSNTTAYDSGITKIYFNSNYLTDLFLVYTGNCYPLKMQCLKDRVNLNYLYCSLSSDWLKCVMNQKDITPYLKRKKNPKLRKENREYWVPLKGERYYFFYYKRNGKWHIESKNFDPDDIIDLNNISFNNYFKTTKGAKEKMEGINKIYEMIRENRGV